MKKIIFVIVSVLVLTGMVGYYLYSTGFRPTQTFFSGDSDSDTNVNTDIIISSTTDTGSSGSSAISSTQKSWTTGSPFGIADHFTKFSEISSGMEDLGVKFFRLAGPNGIVWDMVTKSGWTSPDLSFNTINQAGLELSVVILAGNPVANNKLAEYSAFVKEVVKRYPFVSYWEIDNEPDLDEPEDPEGSWVGEISETPDYALTLKTAYEAIKAENPKAKVAIAGMAYKLDYYESIFSELKKLDPNKKYFDVFNYHHYGKHDDYINKPQFMPSGEKAGSLQEVIALLDEYGYTDTKIIITETGTFSGTMQVATIAKNFSGQTESQQAVSLVKRYVYALSTERVTKICWFKAFYSTDAMSIKGKLAYYSYKKMTEILEGSDFANIEKVYSADGVYAYKIIKNNQPIFVAWNDNLVNKEVSFSVGNLTKVKITEAVPKYNSGSEVSNYNSAFNIGTGKISGGKLTLTLGQSPVYIEVTTESLTNYTPTIYSQTVSSTSSQTTTGQKPANSCIEACIATGKTPQQCIPQCPANQPPASTSTNQALPPGVTPSCGDGFCGMIEKQNNSCPADCE